jgi:hypothetical protein
MKRFFIVALALSLALSMVSFAAAEDRLSLSGSYRVESWIRNDRDYNDGAADDQAFFDQRFRIGGTITAAEGVTAHFRFDLGEGTWGGGGMGTIAQSGRPVVTTGNTGATDTAVAGTNHTHTGGNANVNSQFQLDRSFLQVDRELFRFRAGQQYSSFGHAIVMDHNATSFWLRLNLPVQIDLLYTKDSEGGNLMDNTGNEDRDLYGVQLVYVTDNYSLGAFYIGVNDDSANDNSPNAFGLHARLGWGALELLAELDFLGGENGNNDLTGAQFWVQGTYTLSDKFSLRGDLYYAKGRDENDANEVQVEAVTDWGSFLPVEAGSSLETWHGSINGTTFDPLGDNSGVIGFSLSGVYKVIEALDLSLGFTYLTPENDSAQLNAARTWDSSWIINAGIDYDLMEALSLKAAVSHHAPSFSDNPATPDDAATVALAVLQVNF